MTKAAVIGLGTMGPGIAATLARAGYDVSTYDADAGQRDKAKAGFRYRDHGAGQSRRTGSAADVITVAETLADCVAAPGMVVENVSEKLDVKIKVFQESQACGSTRIAQSPRIPPAFRSPRSRKVSRRRNA